MPRTRRSSSSQDLPPDDDEGDNERYHSQQIHIDDTMAHFLFKHFDDCQDGYSGRGYAKTSILRHIKDHYWPTQDRLIVCKEKIGTQLVVYQAWEHLLNLMEMWL